MKITFLCESVLTEDIEAVKSRYNVDDDTFNTILNFDPTYKENSNSVGKYTKWMLDKFKVLGFPKIADVHGNLVDIDTSEVYIEEDNISKFDDLKSTLPNTDIGQFKTFEDFAKVCDTLSEDNLTNRQKERRMRNSTSDKDIKLVLDTPNWKVYTPLTFSGSCTLGKGTRWCTATTDNDSQYKRYTKKGPLYVIINKSNPSEKYQLHLETLSFMDKEDDCIERDEFKHLYSDEKLREFLEQLSSSQKEYPLPDTFTQLLYPGDILWINSSDVFSTAIDGDSDASSTPSFKKLLPTLVQLKLKDDKDLLAKYNSDEKFKDDTNHIIRKEWDKLITREINILLEEEAKKLGFKYDRINRAVSIPKSLLINSDTIPERSLFAKLVGGTILPYHERRAKIAELIQKLFSSQKIQNFKSEDYIDDYKKYFCK